MATAFATAWIKIKADTRTVKGDVESGVSRARFDQTGRKHGRLFGTGFGKAAATSIGAAFAAIGVASMVSKFITDAREINRVTRITEAVIKSTGGAANVTARQVSQLSSQMGRLAGVDDATVQAGENMLLTFTNVRNEVGKGNDIFNRASRSLLDMSAAMHGGDVSSESLRKTAIQLGKALNDPVAGLSALRRVGVSFTKTQQEMIKGWVEHGQIVRAQKFILKELEREFGGTAAAAADPLQRLRVMFKQVGEAIGNWLLTPLNHVVDYITETVVPAVEKMWRKTGPILKKFWDTALHGPGPAGGALPGFRPPAPAGHVPAARPTPAPAAPAGHAPAIAPAGGAGMSVPTPPSVWQKIALWVHNVAVTVGRELAPAFQAIGRLWTNTIWPAFQKAMPYLKAGFNDWKDAIGSAFRSLGMIWKAAAPFIGPVLKVALALLVIAFRTLGWVMKNVVAPVIRVLAVILAAFFRVAFALLSNLIANFRGMATKIHDAWSTVVGFLKSAWRAAVDVVKAVVRGMVMRVLDFFGMILVGAAKMLGWVPGVGPKLKTAVTAFQKFRDQVNAALGGVNGRTVSVGVAFAEAQAGRGNPYFNVATGGPISGPGGPTDDRAGLFALSNDEYVVRAASHRKYGTKAMDAVNRGAAAIQYRAAGGSAGQGVQVRPDLPPQSVINSVVNRAVLRMAAQFAATMGNLAIVADAMRWIGKIPYVWGGVSVPGGADCSGFVQAIYGRHRISAPRTSEAQGAWVRRTPPIPGGLAFYDSPAGGPPPGHVAIVGRNGMVISQGGGMGPQYVPLRSMALMFTGIPPTGFAKGGVITEPILGIGRSGRRYSFGENGEETVIPGRARGGPLVVIENVHVRETADVYLLARRLSFEAGL